MYVCGLDFIAGERCGCVSLRSLNDHSAAKKILGTRRSALIRFLYDCPSNSVSSRRPSAMSHPHLFTPTIQVAAAHPHVCPDETHPMAQRGVSRDHMLWRLGPSSGTCSALAYLNAGQEAG